MKNLMKETTNPCAKPEIKAGHLLGKRIAQFLNLSINTSQTVNLESRTIASAYREEENLTNNLEAELKNASVRAYASTVPIR